MPVTGPDFISLRVRAAGPSDGQALQVLPDVEQPQPVSATTSSTASTAAAARPRHGRGQ